MRNNSSESSPQSGRSKWWRLLLKYAVPPIMTVGLCWLLFTGVDLGEMLRIVRTECSFGWIAAAMCLSIVSHIIRAMRWRMQLKALGVPTPLFIVVLSIFGTYAVNLILPRLGEIWRTGYIASRQNAPFTSVFGSMIADRLADTVTVLLITLATLLLAGEHIIGYLRQNPDAFARIESLLTSPWLWAAAVAMVAAVWAVIARRPRPAFVEKIIGMLRGVWQGFAVIASMPGKGLWVLLTLLLWSCYFIQLYLCFFAFPLTAEVAREGGVVAVLVCFVLSSISMGVPSNGGIGPYQWALMWGLSMYASAIPGLTKEYTATFANMVMGSQTLLLILLGIFTFIAIAVDKRHRSSSK